MKKTITTLLTLAFASTLFAADPTSLNKSLTEAKKSDKKVMLTLTPNHWGSKVKSDLLKNKDFKSYSDSNLVVLVMDRTVDDTQEYISLINKYNIKSVPTLIVLDNQGKELMRVVSKNPFNNNTLEKIKSLNKKKEEKSGDKKTKVVVKKSK